MDKWFVETRTGPLSLTKTTANRHVLMLGLCELQRAYKYCLIHLFQWRAGHAPGLCLMPVSMLSLSDVISVWSSILNHSSQYTTVAAENGSRHHPGIK